MARCCAEPFSAEASGFGATVLDVTGLADFVAGLRQADQSNPGSTAQHRYFDPAVEVDGDRAEIWLSGEVYNADAEASQVDGGTVRVSGLQTRYRAVRGDAGWRLSGMQARYLWRRMLPSGSSPALPLRTD